MPHIIDFPTEAIVAWVDSRQNKAVVSAKTWLHALEDTAISGDPGSLAGLEANGKFIINNDAVNHVIEINGADYTFLAGKVYFCNFDLYGFVLRKAADSNFNMTLTTAAAFAANGVTEPFLG